MSLTFHGITISIDQNEDGANTAYILEEKNKDIVSFSIHDIPFICGYLMASYEYETRPGMEDNE